MAPTVPGDVEIPNKMLIDEVKKRPIIYDKSVQGYTSNDAKKIKWQEIGSIVFARHWSQWTKIEKREAVLAMQKRWGNLRTSFARELKRNLMVRNSEGVLEQRKYRYHDRMTFLIKFMAIKLDGQQELQLPLYDNQSEDENQEEMRQDWQDDYEEQYLEEPSQDDDFPKDTSSSSGLGGSKLKKIKKEQYHEVVVTDPLTQQRREQSMEEGVDQDVNFAMSLIPMMKALSFNKKLEAQIEILKVFQRITD